MNKKLLLAYASLCLPFMSHASGYYGKISGGAELFHIPTISKFQDEMSADALMQKQEISFSRAPVNFFQIELGMLYQDFMVGVDFTSISPLSLLSKVKAVDKDGHEAAIMSELMPTKLKDSYAICGKVGYNIPLSNLFSINLNAKLGFNTAATLSDIGAVMFIYDNNKDAIETLDVATLTPITGGLGVDIAYKIADNLRLEWGYALDVCQLNYSKSLLDYIEAKAPKIKTKIPASEFMFQHKLALGVRFMF